MAETLGHGIQGIALCLTETSVTPGKASAPATFETARTGIVMLAIEVIGVTPKTEKAGTHAMDRSLIFASLSSLNESEKRRGSETGVNGLSGSGNRTETMMAFLTTVQQMPLGVSVTVTRLSRSLIGTFLPTPPTNLTPMFLLRATTLFPWTTEAKSQETRMVRQEPTATSRLTSHEPWNRSEGRLVLTAIAVEVTSARSQPETTGYMMARKVVNEIMNETTIGTMTGTGTPISAPTPPTSVPTLTTAPTREAMGNGNGSSVLLCPRI